MLHSPHQSQHGKQTQATLENFVYIPHLCLNEWFANTRFASCLTSYVVASTQMPGLYGFQMLPLRLNPGLGLVDWHEYAAQPNGWIRAVPWMRLNMETPEELLDSSVEPVE